MMCRAGMTLLLTVLLLPVPCALAQETIPSRGMVARSPYLPALGHRGLADPVPLLGSSNPAAIGLVQGQQLSFAWDRRVQGGRLASRLLGPVSLGLGLDHLAADAETQGWLTHLSVGLDFSRVASFGFVWQHMAGEGDLVAADPLSLGLLVRPTSWFSLAVTAHNITEQGGDGAAEPWRHRAQFGAGLALRPGTDRVQVGLEVTVDREGDVWDPALTLTGRPVDGVEVGVRGFARGIDGEWDFGGGATLALFSPYGDAVGGAAWGAETMDYFGAARWTTTSEPSRLTPGRAMVKLALPSAFVEAPRGGLLTPPGTTLLEYRQALAEMARDPDVGGVFLTIRKMGTGWAQTQELARSIQELRAAGKTVVAYLLYGGNQAVYLAAQADKVVTNPATALLLTGVHSVLNFYADFLADFGLEAQFVRVGRFKSYPEKFQRRAPSEAWRISHEAMLDTAYAQLVDGIAGGRGVTTERVRQWIDAGPYGARRALADGLVDAVEARTDLPALLKSLGLPRMRLTASWPLRRVRETDWGPRPRIGVVVVQGTIIDGTSFTVPLLGMRLVGGESICKAFKEAERDPTIKGVLVRIDSPGGSALASELMNRQLRRLAQRKPVVVSVGNVAASGGYYLAVAGPEIYLLPGSVTGSIGVWFGKVVVSGLLDKLGIQRTHFQRGANAGLLELDVRLDEEQLAEATRRIEEIYDLFIQRVAEGRDMPPEAVERIAQGRVWRGSQALEHKLADHDGGSLEALRALLRRVGLAEDEKVELVYLPRKSLAQRLAESFTGASAESVAEETMTRLGTLLESLTSLNTWAWFVQP